MTAQIVTMAGQEKLSISSLEEHGAIGSAAAIATDDEHSLTFREACKRFPKAVFWAIAISLTIVVRDLLWTSCVTQAKPSSSVPS